VQCIYELDASKNLLFSEDEAGSGVIEDTHTPNPDGSPTSAECNAGDPNEGHDHTFTAAAMRSGAVTWAP